ncbi:MAG: right-handed parallel beta-helix repeat-containing protein [Desulfobacterales bacterium]|nr:right-handed parallel beta-helix repeat-containing protein [Desulfobacterales bacterium]
MSLKPRILCLLRLTAVVLAVLGIAACGGGGSSDTGTGASQETPIPDEVPGDPARAYDCGPLDTVVGDVITVSDAAQLASAVATVNAAGGNATILLEDGQYDLDNLLHITAGHVVIRGRSGERERVVIQGTGMSSGVAHVFLVAASHVTIADLSLGEVYYHGIQVQGENGADYLRVHNVRFFNTGEQMLKGSYSGSRGSNHGVVECSLFEYTAAFGPQYYIGGIDVHHGADWVVRGNTFKNIRSPGGALAEFAVHFWSDAENPVIEKNVIVNCDRGIGLGLGERGCAAGLIRNNTIYADDQGLFNDVGIGLESASNVEIYNNTIFLDHAYDNAVEYRFAVSTGNVIVNNLTNKAIRARDGGAALTRNNVTSAQAGWFVHSASGDLHLSQPVASVVDAGERLDEVPDDMDGETRPAGGGYDLGADEYAN